MSNSPANGGRPVLADASKLIVTFFSVLFAALGSYQRVGTYCCPDQSSSMALCSYPVRGKYLHNFYKLFSERFFQEWEERAQIHKTKNKQD